MPNLLTLLPSRVFFPLHPNAVDLLPRCRVDVPLLPEILLHESDFSTRVFGSLPWLFVSRVLESLTWLFA